MTAERLSLIAIARALIGIAADNAKEPASFRRALKECVESRIERAAEPPDVKREALEITNEIMRH